MFVVNNRGSRFWNHFFFLISEFRSQEGKDRYNRFSTLLIAYEKECVHKSLWRLH